MPTMLLCYRKGRSGPRKSLFLQRESRVSLLSSPTQVRISPPQMLSLQRCTHRWLITIKCLVCIEICQDESGLDERTLCQARSPAATAVAFLQDGRDTGVPWLPEGPHRVGDKHRNSSGPQQRHCAVGITVSTAAAGSAVAAVSCHSNCLVGWDCPVSACFDGSSRLFSLVIVLLCQTTYNPAAQGRQQLTKHSCCQCLHACCCLLMSPAVTRP